MIKKTTILVLSLPRSGSSLLTNLIASSGYIYSLTKGLKGSFVAHEFNKGGYFEDVVFTLLNDQLIRLYFGLEYSFLNPPPFKKFLETVANGGNKLPSSFNYDVNYKTVKIPNNFIKDIMDFTGTDWDVWGITRMINGGKWENCYSKNEINTKNKILIKRDFYKYNLENSKKSLVLKDPRLALVIPFYQFKNIKVIWIKRKKEDVLKSMRRHYGPRLFTKHLIPNTNFVSNHFNYKVPPLDFNDYIERYENIIKYSVKHYSNLIIDFDDLISLKEIKKLEDFIGGKIDRSIISPKPIHKSS